MTNDSSSYRNPIRLKRSRAPENCLMNRGETDESYQDIASAMPSPSRINFAFSRTPSIDTTDTTNFKQPSSLEEGSVGSPVPR
jgi:hypothetical protein